MQDLLKVEPSLEGRSRGIATVTWVPVQRNGGNIIRVLDESRGNPQVPGMSDMHAIADERFNAALSEVGARDPRPFYRERLRALKTADPAAFREAVEYYEGTLIPEVAREGSDPLAAWLEYGRFLATGLAAGETVQIDPTGRSWPYTPPVPRDHLVLHLPSSLRDPALAVGLPVELSEPQRAAYNLLVSRKTG